MMERRAQGSSSLRFLRETERGSGCVLLPGIRIVILAALHRLGAGPDIEHSPPTKQGGV